MREPVNDGAVGVRGVRVSAGGIALAGTLCAAACGGGDSLSFPTGGAGGAPPTGAGGGTRTSASGGGSPVVSCAGTWGAPELLMSDSSGSSIGSLAITQNELVLYYVSVSVSTTLPQPEVRVSSRASKSDPFAAGTPVAELMAICLSPAEPLLDVTQNGLDAYVGCYPSDQNCAAMTCEVHHASRGSTADTFHDDGVVASGIGASPSIAPEQLTLYTSPPDPNAAVPAPVFATRATTSTPFGTPMALPGATAWTAGAFGPEVSPDGLELYASSTNPQQLVMSRRATKADPFPQPMPLAALPSAVASGSPDLSGDCRALYFVAASGGSPYTYGVYVMRR